MEVSSVGSGCHVANRSHLVTLELDTALIDDMRRDEVVRDMSPMYLQFKKYSCHVYNNFIWFSYDLHGTNPD